MLAIAPWRGSNALAGTSPATTLLPEKTRGMRNVVAGLVPAIPFVSINTGNANVLTHRLLFIKEIEAGNER
jgi:hypothetical protein